MNAQKIKFRRRETPKIELDYDVELNERGKGFNFHIATDTDNEDITSGITISEMMKR